MGEESVDAAKEAVTDAQDDAEKAADLLKKNK
jgi:translation elongation factor EF-Ts